MHGTSQRKPRWAGVSGYEADLTILGHAGDFGKQPSPQWSLLEAILVSGRHLGGALCWWGLGSSWGAWGGKGSGTESHACYS